MTAPPNNDDVRAWMKSLGFTWYEHSNGWSRPDNPTDITSRETHVDRKAAAFFYEQTQVAVREARLSQINAARAVVLAYFTTTEQLKAFRLDAEKIREEASDTKQTEARTWRNVLPSEQEDHQ